MRQHQLGQMIPDLDHVGSDLDEGVDAVAALEEVALLFRDFVHESHENPMVCADLVDTRNAKLLESWAPDILLGVVVPVNHVGSVSPPREERLELPLEVRVRAHGLEGALAEEKVATQRFVREEIAVVSNRELAFGRHANLAVVGGRPVVHSQVPRGTERHHGDGENDLCHK
eukprot:Amastigsp_a841655_711.p2 type:complete len:172 gc:universal Amastigsp_a841655_711:559-44(-)